MNKINAVITGIGGYVPEYILDNHELSRMMDTSDEWITTRVGIKERRILKEPNSGPSIMAVKAAEELFSKTGTKPEEIDLIIVATSTADYIFPSCASIIAEKLNIKTCMYCNTQYATVIQKDENNRQILFQFDHF